MREPITLYGEPTCEDTDAVRDFFAKYNIPYREINIDEDELASQFVIFVNTGYRSTPTLVFGEGKRKLILTEPTPEQLRDGLYWAGYLPHTPEG